jgi:hypothetical protein
MVKMLPKGTYTNIRIGKCLLFIFRIQSGLKQGNDLSALLFNFASVYAIKKVEENQERLEFNGIHPAPDM